LARLAVILHEGSLTFREARLARILDFWGVPWRAASVSELVEVLGTSVECVVFGSICAVGAALQGIQQANHAASKFPFPSFYTYLDEDRVANERGVRLVLRCAELSLQKPSVANLSFVVSREFADLVGPLAGLGVISIK
jgi:hypothetical protein